MMGKYEKFFNSIFICAAKEVVVPFSEPIYWDGNELLSFEAGQELLTPRDTDETYNFAERDIDPRFFRLYKSGYDLILELMSGFKKQKENARINEEYHRLMKGVTKHGT